MARRFDPAEIPKSPDLRFENTLWAHGALYVAGIDEAGRGAWAGPVVAGAVILPARDDVITQLCKVRDSKQMVPAQRTYWAAEIRNVALTWGIGFASNQEIDTIGIVPATRLAMLRALAQLTLLPDHLLIDAVRLPEAPIPQTALIKGDARSLSIAAASVLAKTARDALMIEMDSSFPQYGFARHKGYGTLRHQQALQQYGPCVLHRFSFAPLKNRS